MIVFTSIVAGCGGGGGSDDGDDTSSSTEGDGGPSSSSGDDDVDTTSAFDDDYGDTSTSLDDDGSSTSTAGESDTTTTSSEGSSSSSSDEGDTSSGDSSSSSDDAGNMEEGEVTTTTAGETLGDIEADAVIVWSNVFVTPGCFTFSGPDTLGDAATWQMSFPNVDLVFPTAIPAFPPGLMFDPVYSGTFDEQDLVLEGVTVLDVFGDLWQITETFTGVGADEVYTGTYGYTECNTAAPETCPADGMCIVTADFQMTLR